MKNKIIFSLLFILMEMYTVHAQTLNEFLESDFSQTSVSLPKRSYLYNLCGECDVWGREEFMALDFQTNSITFFPNYKIFYLSRKEKFLNSFTSKIGYKDLIYIAYADKYYFENELKKLSYSHELLKNEFISKTPIVRNGKSYNTIISTFNYVGGKNVNVIVYGFKVYLTPVI